MAFIDKIKERAKADKKTIVLPESMDKRTYEAAEKILKEGIANLIIIGTPEEIEKNGLENVTVAQTGCIGICQYEPVVEVFEDGKDKVTYVKMTADKAKRVVAEHLKGGKPVEEYVIGNK